MWSTYSPVPADTAAAAPELRSAASTPRACRLRRERTAAAAAMAARMLAPGSTAPAAPAAALIALDEVAEPLQDAVAAALAATAATLRHNCVGRSAAAVVRRKSAARGVEGDKRPRRLALTPRPSMPRLLPTRRGSGG